MIIPRVVFNFYLVVLNPITFLSVVLGQTTDASLLINFVRCFLDLTCKVKLWVVKFWSYNRTSIDEKLGRSL